MPKVRLIDANALIQAHCGACANKEFCAEEVCQHYEIRKRIETAPTIEPEVRRGRWETWGYVFHGIEWKRCSCCGKCADVSYYGLLDGEIKMSTPAICGCCGARMDAEQPIAYNQAHTGAITAEQFEAIWNDKDDGRC